MVKSSEHERNMAWELDHAKATQFAEQQQQQQMALMPGLAGLDAASLALLGIHAGMPLPGSMPAQQAGPAQDLDDVDEEGKGGGLRLNAAARMSLMNKLAGSAGIQMAKAPAATATVDLGLALDRGILGPASPIPTPFILLKVGGGWCSRLLLGLDCMGYFVLLCC